MHDRQHRKSCFKSNSNSCRYKTPHEPCQKTEVIPICNCKIQESDTNEAGKNLSRKFNQAAKKEEIERLHFSVKQRPVFMFLTDCNLSVLSVLNCNNCTKYVHDQKISLYYGAYASKHNSDNEKSLVELMTALSKYEEKIRNVKPKDHEEHESNSQPQHAQRSHASIGLGRLLSGARAATNGETVGAPLASFAARGNRIFEMSHETAVLPLTQALAYLLGEPLRSSINRDGVVLASTYDYVFRTRDDETIASMTYWDFVTIMETYPLKSVSVAKQDSNNQNTNLDDTEEDDTDDDVDIVNDKRCQRPVFPFEKEHPQHKTRGLRKRKNRRWPRYTSKRLPNLAQLEEDINSAEVNGQRESYAQGALIMFHPFRNLSDLLDCDSSWWESYLKRKPTIYNNPESVKALGSIQNFYESFCSSGEAVHEGENLVDDAGQPLEPVPEEDDVHAEEISLDGIPELHQENADASIENILTDPFVSRLATLPNTTIRLKADSCQEVVSMSAATEALRQLPESQNKQDTFILPGRSSNTHFDVSELSASVNGNEISNGLERNTTRVQLLEHIQLALQQRTTHRILLDGNEPTENNSRFPTLEEQSHHWKLNNKQHLAFVLLGTALLQYISTSQTSEDCALTGTMRRLKSAIEQLVAEILPDSKQLVMFLGGSGGTGKSRVIQTFVDYARRWEASTAVVVCASSGVAAMLIGGCTLHSALGIQRSLHPRNPTATQIAAWSEIGIVFVDEFSMIQAGLFDLLESRLRKLKARLDKPFGGVHIVFSGDFYQLPPVGVSVYRMPTFTETKNDSNALASLRGYHLWQTCLTDAIIRSENVRQTSDKQWADALQRWRRNQPTQHDIDAVNARLLTGVSNSPLIQPPDGTLAAVSDNKNRENGLRFCEINMCVSLLLALTLSDNWRSTGVLIVKARITQASGHQAIRSEQENYISRLGSKRLGGPGQLYCVIDAPYMVTNNEDVSKGIANGTMATLKDIVLKPNVKVVFLPTHGRLIGTVYADDVECLIFQHTIASWKALSVFPSLPIGCSHCTANQKT